MKNYNKPINTKKYQVFLFICHGNIPFSFASHPWVVLNKKGRISRWEILFRKKPGKKRWGHLYKDFFPLFQGVEIFPYVEEYFWEPKLLSCIEGGRNSAAHKAINFVEKSKNTYPYNYIYFLTGPNSNTYVQWILDNFPEFRVKLPWNSFGKNYK